MVSVIIPAYNAATYLEEAVQSVLAQTYTNFEIIIVDDASTDDTGVLAEHIARTDPRIHVIHHTNNKFRSGALNTGIDNAKGEYISFLDADDLYIPDKLEKQIAFMEKYPDIDMVYGDFITFNTGKENETVHKSVELPDNPRNILVDAQHNAAITTLKPYQILGQHDKNKIIPGCSVCIRKRVFKKVRYDERIRTSQDYDMWFQIIGKGYTLARLPIVTYKYRYHQNQITKNTDLMNNSQKQILDKIISGSYLNGHA